MKIFFKVLLIVLTALAVQARAAVCTVNNGLIEPPNPDIQLNAVAGVPGLVIGVGEPTCDFASPCNDKLGVVYVNGVAATLPVNTAQLNAVSVASTTYAVAVGDNKFGTTPLVQFNGTTWTAMPTGGTEPTQDANGVKTYGPSQTYVVGDQGIYFFDGTTWTRQFQTGSVPAVNGQSAGKFEAIWGSSTQVYALADNGALYVKAPTTPPTGWSRITAAYPAGANQASFNGLAGDAAGNVYVTGQTDNNQGFIYKYNPVTTTWTNVYTTAASFDMNAIAVDPVTGAITAVGDNGAQLISAANGAGPWTETAPANNVNDINGVYIAANGTSYLAGQTDLGCTSSMARPVAEYRMDEPSWNGTVGEVKNSVVGGIDATAANGAANGVGKVCRGAIFDGTNDFLTVSGFSSQLSGTASLSFWIKTTQVGSNSPWTAPGVTGVEQNGGTNDIFWGFINATGKIAVQKGNTLGAQSTSSINNGAWRHIVLTREQSTGATKAYVDGVLENTKNSETGLVTMPFASLGRIQTPFVSGVLSGSLDEVKVFADVLSSVQVASIYANELAGKNWDGSARVCPVFAPHHLEISDAGNGVGLTCTPSTLTIKACADAACTTPYTNGFSGTLTATGVVTANWGGGTPDFVIPAGSSSVTKTLQLTAANADVATTLGASSTASNPATCTFASCRYTAYNAGFMFDVPHHVAGVAQTVSVRSVKKADNSGACVPGFANVTRTVQASCSYTNPVAGALPVQVNSRYLNPGNSASAMCAATSPVSLSFDAAGVASATVTYPDAGDMGLNMTYTGAAASADAGLVMQGADAFVAVPASLVFSGIPAAPLVAGAPFNVTVTAMNGATPPAATPNFGHETAPAVVTLSSANPQPGLGNASAISIGLSGFAAGAASTNLTWNEVGTIDLAALHANYLGSNLSAAGAQVGVGRFQPAYFDVSVTPGCGTFTYAGSVTPAKTGQPLVVTVKAKRFGGDATDASNTANYAGSYAFATTLSNAGSLVGLSSNTIATSGFANGIGTAAVTYAGAVEKIAPLTLTLRALDGDTPGVSSVGHAEGTALLRSGRLALKNGYGSELLALPMSLEAQYWAGSFYTTNTADNCTALPISSIVMSGYTGGLAACETQLTPTGTVTLAGGKLAGLKLTKPGAGNQGSVNLAVNVSATAAGNTCVAAAESPATAANLPWFGPNLGNRATFGIYKSPLIYRRENY